MGQFIKSEFLSQYEDNVFDEDVYVGEDQGSIDYDYQKTQQRSD